MQKIGTFVKSNPVTTVNVFLHTASRSELNEKCSEQAKVLMIENSEHRHCTAIKN